MRIAIRALKLIAWLCSTGALTGTLLAAEVGGPEAASTNYNLNAELRSGIGASLRRGTAPVEHLSDLTAEQAHARAARVRNRGEVLREKLESKWFAALLNADGPEPLAIAQRLATWSELMDYIASHKALVEAWADPGGGDLSRARRIPASELAALQIQTADQPVVLTVTCRDPGDGQIHSYQVEFAFDAASRALTALNTADPVRVGGPAAEPLLAALHLAGAGDGPTKLLASLPLGSAPPEGGVVEQVVLVQSGTPLPAEVFQPRVHPGAKAVEDRYTQVLGDLLEWRRFLQRKALGRPAREEADVSAAAGALEDLASKDIWIDDTDALVALDAFNESFIYRRFIRGVPRLVKLTRIPNRADLVTAVAKAETARRAEMRERAALAPNGHGLALVHQVREVNGRPEIGPLILSEESPDGIEGLMTLLDRLPVTVQASLRFEGFSGAMVDADLDGRGSHDRFFITLQFPPGKSIERERTNPLTGERELLVERDGLLLRTITEARVVEVDYSSDRVETARRIYVNQGSRTAPVKGALLEEMRTLESWPRDLTQSDLDPYRPTLAKSKVNHITGETTHEIYGLFPWPVATVDEQWITSRQFNPFGILTAASVFENGRNEEDFGRWLLLKLNEPVIGRRRFQLSSTLPAQDLAHLRNLAAQHYLVSFVRRDLVKGSITLETLDNSHWGRKISDSYTDRLEGTNLLPVKVSLEYRDDFCQGLIPSKATEQSTPSGRELSHTEMITYDPVQRRRVGVEMDDTGKSVTNVWDYRWTMPVESQTAGWRTARQFNHDETEFTGQTSAMGSGEELRRFTAHFDPGVQHWRIQRVNWFRPGITNSQQTVTLSGAGRLLSVRNQEACETRCRYGPAGVQEAAETYRKGVSGAFDLLQERADDYQWTAGVRNARVQRYVLGQPYDSFRRLTDVEDRVLVDELRERPGLSLKTLFSYDGWTARPLKAELLQNGLVRWTRQWQPEEHQPDGSNLLPVRVVPYWGLARVEAFRVGDPFARPVRTQFENGETLAVTQWFDGIDLPQKFELRDRYGHTKQRFTRHLNAALDGATRSDVLVAEKLSFWGSAVTIEQKELLQGTDLPRCSIGPEGKVLYDLSQPSDLPRFAVDPEGQSGRTALIDGEKREHVVAIFRARLENRTGTEGLLILDRIDFPPAGAPRAIRRSFDRAGHLLDERVTFLPASTGSQDKAEALFAAFDSVPATERFHYRYQPGWLVERSDPAGQGRTLTFSQKQPEAGGGFAVNLGPSREFLTGVDGIRSAPGPKTDVRSYFFRRVHTPVQIERNAFLPGCSNVWTSWRATELGADGARLFDSELICDAQGHASVSQARRVVGRGQSSTVLSYQLPEPDPGAWTVLRLAGKTNSFALDLGGVSNLNGCAFLYFYLQNTNGATWNILFTSASGRTVRIRNTAGSVGNGEVSPYRLATLPDRWPDPAKLIQEKRAVVGAPHSALGRASAVAIAVSDLEQAGLDVAHVSGAQLLVKGNAGDLVSLSPVARLMRAPAGKSTRAGKSGDASL